MRLRITVAWVLLAILTAAFAWYVSKRPMDFRVYHYGARGVFDGSRPVYGPTSGLGWPMHYRYPPLFLFLFTPFAWLPLGFSAACWVVAKSVVLILLVRAFARRLPSKPGVSTWLIPLLLAGPFVIQEFRYGNAQFFVFALTAVALLLAREKPLTSAAALGLGIALKIWPLFFMPYLLVRKDTKVAAAALAAALILTFLPSLYFGFGGTTHLLGEWFVQEFATQAGPDEIWFPSQSLRGVLMRYLTVIDYSQVPDSNYRLVNLASLDPGIVRTIWIAGAAAVYIAFLWLAHIRRQTAGWFEAALGFCLVGLLEPFTQKYALVILLWPAIVAARTIDSAAARNLVYLSIALVVIQPLIPGSAAQRYLQVLGFDFAATLALAIALTFVSYAGPEREPPR